MRLKSKRFSLSRNLQQIVRGARELRNSITANSMRVHIDRSTGRLLRALAYNEIIIIITF